METSAKANDGVEDAFFTLARYVALLYAFDSLLIYGGNRDIKTRLIDSQGDAGAAAGTNAPDGSVRVNPQTAAQSSP
ncbi:hypothetical protein C0991_003676, partial [Blastosporella zonata]